MPHPSPSPRRNAILAGVAGVVLMLVIAAAAGQDYNWDLLNYHFASPRFLLSGRYGVDVAPSGLQSWFNPIGYIPAYLAIRYLPPWLASATFAVVGGLAAPLLYRIADRIGTDLAQPARTRASFACVAVGMTGALTLSEAGTTFLDVPLGIAVLGAVMAAIRGAEAEGRDRAVAFVVAGALLGAATGLKLTNAAMALGMVCAVATMGALRRLPPGAVVALGTGLIGGYLLTGGWWAWRLWRTMRNPVFPMFNQIFRSPYAPLRSLNDPTFLPHDWTGVVAFPWHWLVGDTMPGTEIDVRDPRLALLLAASLIVAVATLARHRRDRPERAGATIVALFCLWSYAVWIVTFAILRYIVALEMMSGIAILAALCLLPSRHTRAIPAIMILAAFGLALTTRHAVWGRARFSGDWFGVRGLEQVHRPGTAYILPGDTPLGFLMQRFPPDARFARIGGTFPLIPDQGLGPRVTAMIRAAPHLRSLAAAPTTDAEVAALRRFGLVPSRGDCRNITTKRADVESCALERLTPSRRP